MPDEFPVEVAVSDPWDRDDAGRPRLVFVSLSSEEDLARLEAQIESDRYRILGALEPRLIVSLSLRKRRRRKRLAPEAPHDGIDGDAAGMTEAPSQ